MKKKKKIIVVISCIVGLWVLLFVLRLSFSRIDYNRVLDGQKPIFAYSLGIFKDGGTVQYQGIGYSITSLHRLHPKDGEVIGYDCGPILRSQLNWIFFPFEKV